MKVQILPRGPILGVRHEYKTSVDIVLIIIQIKETKQLLKECKDPAKAKILQNELTSYLAIKDIFDKAQE